MKFWWFLLPHTQVNASPITKITSWLEFLGKNLHLVSCATVCGKIEVMLTYMRTREQRPTPPPKEFLVFLGTFHQKLSIKLLVNLNTIFSAVYNRIWFVYRFKGLVILFIFSVVYKRIWFVYLSGQWSFLFLVQFTVSMVYPRLEIVSLLTLPPPTKAGA